MSDFSLNAPNDIFNRRKQVTLTFADNITYNRGSHTFRFGVEHKRNFFDTNLPEEQGVEFEVLTNFTELLTGFVPEADVSLGITDKQFRFNDLSFYVSDDYRFSEKLTLNLGLRWDWFGLPTEKMGGSPISIFPALPTRTIFVPDLFCRVTRPRPALTRLTAVCRQSPELITNTR